MVLLCCVPLVLRLPRPATHQVLRSDRAVLRTSGFWYSALAILFAMTAFGTLDGVLPLHFATHLSQAQIGLSYTLMAVLVAVASAIAGRTRPALALTVGVVAVTVGVAVAGATGTVAAWAVALVAIGFGAGGAETGSTGVLLDRVPRDSVVPAMVVWSQVGILGYLIAPTLGGQVVSHLGFGWLGLVPLTSALAVLCAALLARRSTPSPAVHGGVINAG